MADNSISYICGTVPKPFEYVDFGKIFSKNVSEFPEKEMQVCYNVDGSRSSMTFRQFDSSSEQLSKFLVKSNLKTEIVGILGKNSFEWTIAFLATLKAGSAVMGLNAGDKTGSDIVDVVRISGCRALFLVPDGNQLEYYNTLVNIFVAEYPNVLLINVSDIHIPGVKIKFGDINKMNLEDVKLPSVSPEDNCCINITSGTTKAPKLAVWKHFQMMNHFLMSPNSADDISFNNRSFAWLFGSPFFESIYGWKRIFTEDILSDPDCKNTVATIWKYIEEEKCNRASFTLQMAKALGDYSSCKNNSFRLKLMAFSGQVLNQNIAKFLLSNLCNILFNIYGTTETGAVAIQILHGGNIQSMVTGDVGSPFMSEIKISDKNGNALPRGMIGDISIRRHITFSGYIGLNQMELKETFKENGWLYFGDLGLINEHGHLIITGRRKNVINRDGTKVSPEVIEDAISQLPEIKCVLVVPVPDDKVGEEICALYISKNKEGSSGGELQAHCESFFRPKSEMTGVVRTPKYFLCVQSIPLLSSGKPDRIKARELAIQMLNLK